MGSGPERDERTKRTGRKVALVLSGGGARGAYEVGVLSVLAPVLEQREERPTIILGTSVGALNAAFLAAEAHRPLLKAVEDGAEIWRELTYGSVLGPLLSIRQLASAARYGLGFLGWPVNGPWSILDSSPLRETVEKLISFGTLAKNIRAGVIDTAGVIATSYATGRSVVFHDGQTKPPRDDERAIDYAPTRLDVAHVLASSAIEAVFPAVEVDAPPGFDGWYGDGGTSLNTPLAPAQAFAPDRIVVIGLNAVRGAQQLLPQRRPDVFDGAAQIVQAMLADQIPREVATLAVTNRTTLAERRENESVEPGDAAGVISYIFVTPSERFVIGRHASEIYRQTCSGLGGLRRHRDLALLGRLLDAGRNRIRGELLSYLFFLPEFAAALIEQGRRDAEAWLALPHDDGPWRTTTMPPGLSSPPAAAPTPSQPPVSAAP